VGPSEPEVTLDQGFDATTLPDLRNAVLAGAVAAGLPDDRAAEVTLAVHKLAANAVRHGGGAGRARMRVVAGQLHCQVSDAGPGSPTAMCAAAVVLMRGRGLSSAGMAGGWCGTSPIGLTSPPTRPVPASLWYSPMRDFPGHAAGAWDGSRRTGAPAGSGGGRQ
jgi:hypothetical protein